MEEELDKTLGGGIPGDADETEAPGGVDETLIGPGEGWEPVPVGKDGEDEDDDREPVVAILGREFPRRRVCVAAGLAAVLLLAAVGGGIALSASNGSSGDGGQAATPVVSQAASTEKKVESRVLEIGVAAEGWDEAASSPVIAHIESADGEVDFYHAYAANKAESVEVGRQTSLKVTLISPVNADGSIYKVGEGKTLQSSEKGAASAKTAGSSSATVIAIEKVDAGAVTAGDLTTIAGQVTEAVKKGDSTLTGDAGSKVVSKVEENIKNSPSATEDVKQSVEQQAGQAQEEAKKETSAKVPTTSGSPSGGSSSNSGTSQGGPGNTQSASSGSANSGQSQVSGSSSGEGSSQGGSGNTGSSSGGSVSPSGGNASQGGAGGSSQQDGSTEHQHTWVSETVHHDAITHTETVHHDAVTKQVWHEGAKTSYSICNNCGADITGHEEEHTKASLLEFGNCASWTIYYKTEPGYYDIVTLQDAYDEIVTITDRAAYDEITYHCSSCGVYK